MANRYRNITLQPVSTPQGMHFLDGERLVGYAAYHSHSMYELRFHSDITPGRWPAMVSGIKSAGYVMLAAAHDMVHGGQWE